MSLKQEIETWVTALGHYDNNEFDLALNSFEAIADTSKILFNCGVIHATLGEHEKAVSRYQQAVRLDQYLAIAYFQQGVSNFLMGDFEEALANFNDTLLYLRGNRYIDYEQLGLKFKLYSCEVLFNRGLCYIYLQQNDAGMQDLSYAAKEKAIQDHDVIDEAIREQAEGYTVFSIPVGIVYRPNEAKVKNLKTKDYLGKARLVAAADRNNAFTGFTGAEMKKLNTQMLATARDDRPEEKLSYAAINLVKPGLSSRSRQQSEPPLNRTVFPPTPPPEADKPAATTSSRGSGDSASVTRAQSVRGGGAKPRALDLSVAGFEQAEKPRLGTIRSASERPRQARDYHSSSSPSSGRNRDIPSSRPTRGARETPLRRATTDGQEDGSAYPDELYDMYQPSAGGARYANSGGGSSHQRRMSRPHTHQQPMYIEEEDEEGGGDGEDDYARSSSFDDVDFEIVTTNAANNPAGTSSRAPQPPPQQYHHHQQQRRPSPTRAPSRRPEVRKIRVKVHGEDTRYVMIGTSGSGGSGSSCEFRDFAAQIRAKFGLRGAFKIKMRDEEDMITMADQEDLDMAVQAARARARRERSEMGKMEVWIQEV